MTRGPIWGLFRPITLAPLVVLASSFGWLGLYNSTGSAGINLSEFLTIVLGAVLLTIANGASNIINQVGDVDEDRLHPTKRFRPIASGALDPNTMFFVSLMIWLVALLIAIVFLSLEFDVAYVLIIIFALMYSAPPKYRMKKYLGAGNLVIATPRGAIGIAAAWTLYGSVLAPELWAILLVTTIFVFLANSSKDIDDMGTDVMVGIRNFATVYGPQNARRIALAGFIWPVVPVFALGMWHWDVFLLLVPIIAVIGVYGYYRLTGAQYWVAFYSSYAILGLLFGLSLVPFAH